MRGRTAGAGGGSRCGSRWGAARGAPTRRRRTPRHWTVRRSNAPEAAPDARAGRNGTDAGCGGRGDGGPEAATAEVADEMAPTIAQRRADALGMVAECALAGGLDKGTAGDRYQVVVHVDADTLADDGEQGEDPAAAARPHDSADTPGEPIRALTINPAAAARPRDSADVDGAAVDRAVDDSAAVDRAAARRPGESPAVGDAAAGPGPERPAPYVPAGTYPRRAGEVSPAADEASPALPDGPSRPLPDV